MNEEKRCPGWYGLMKIKSRNAKQAMKSFLDFAACF